jgi:hypothetical protein
MKELVFAVGIFHTFAALSMFGLCVVAVINVVRRRRA